VNPWKTFSYVQLSKVFAVRAGFVSRAFVFYVWSKLNVLAASVADTGVCCVHLGLLRFSWGFDPSPEGFINTLQA
jgi:hypothetical protein